MLKVEFHRIARRRVEALVGRLTDRVADRRFEADRPMEENAPEFQDDHQVGVGSVGSAEVAREDE